jgi:glycosyltransferase involved in cell wall biosynthesis
MSIVIFGDLFSFPEGGAATNRIHTYAKGLRENDINVHVICFVNSYMTQPNGVIDGIHYYNPFEQKERSRYFIIRRWQKLMKYKRTWAVFKKINKADKLKAINVWSDDLNTKFFAWLLAKAVRTKLITECNEHPLRYSVDNIWKRRVDLIKFRFDCYFSDGILCISRYLINFHKQKGVNPTKLFHVPSTVDPSRYSRAGQRPVTEPYIGYFGSLTFKWDNLDLLLKAFALICNRHLSFSLVLGGFYNEDEKKEMLDLIDELKIKQRVRILNFLNRAEIANYVSHANMLVVVRAKDLKSDASYPSKLTEYLATGNPVISVNVGEVSDFLKDSDNAFLVEPGNVDELAKKMEFVINNYEQARRIAEKGKELTSGVFNYRFQARRIVEFINSLYN